MRDAIQPSLRSKFLDAMSSTACTVSVVTTEGKSGRFGVTVSSLSSVSADGEAPTLLVCVHQASPVAAAIVENGRFCVNVLREDHAELADCFAGRIKPADGDKFVFGEWVGEAGPLRLADALAAFDCTVMSAQRVGTHYLFVGGVQGIFTAAGGSALIYANRRYAGARSLECSASPER